MKLFKKSILLLFMLWYSMTSANDTPLVIVNPDVDINELSSRKLLRIYSMQQKRWSNGKKIKVYTLPIVQKAHQDFVINILHSQPYQLERHWKRLLFSGIGKTPTQLKSTDVMIDTIKKTSGAIGYIPANTLIEPSYILEVK